MKTTISFPAKSNNEQAQEAFMHHIANTQELMTVLRRHLDDHLGLEADEINWGHVGDANRVRSALKEIADTFNLDLMKADTEKAAMAKNSHLNDASPRFRARTQSLT